MKRLKNQERLLEEYPEMSESYQGYCTECEDWTRDCTEPDAEGYDCPVCDAHTVIGADMVLMALDC